MNKSVLYILLFTVAIPVSAQSFDPESLLESREGEPPIQSQCELSTHSFQSDRNNAITRAERAVIQARNKKDWEGLAAALDDLGLTFQKDFDYQHAMRAFTEARQIRDEHLDKSGQVTSRLLIGKLFFLMEEYEQAEEYLLKAMVLANRTSLTGHHAEALIALGDVYLAIKSYKKAFDHYGHAIDQTLALGKVEEAAGLHLQLGQISRQLGNFEQALKNFKAALNLYPSNAALPRTGKIHASIAEVLMYLGQYGYAQEYNRQSMALKSENKDTLGLVKSLCLFSRMEMQQGKRGSARSYLRQCEKLLDRLPPVPEASDVYEDMAEAYASLDDYEKAYQYHLSYTTSLLYSANRDKHEALDHQSSRFQSEVATLERRQQIEILKIENEKSRLLNYFLFAVMVLTGFLCVLVYRSYSRKKKDNALLLEKHAEIERQKNEIDQVNAELREKNTALDLLNKKLVDEISERENIERTSFARDRFLAAMSHEMRTPLNIITGLTHLLLENEPRADQADYLRNLQFSANNLIVFINDVLDFSKIEAGKLDMEDRHFYPARIIESVYRRFEKRAGELGLLFSCHQDKRIPERLTGDDARLTQILTNLLSNAFQHTREGFIKMDVSLNSLNDRKAMLEIIIEGTDGGDGRHLFGEKFKPIDIDNEAFEGFDSQDFGLTIAKRLVELQNGCLEMEQEDGYSTIFKIMLPFKRSQGPGSALPWNTNDYAALAGTRILVVEDNKINQLVVEKILRRLDVQVTTADHGAEALEKLRDDCFDLILMDIQMPVMDGYRTVAEIRRHEDPAIKEIPIIALTASAFLTEKEKAVLFGMNDHVGKPFSPVELLEKICCCLALIE